MDKQELIGIAKDALKDRLSKLGRLEWRVGLVSGGEFVVQVREGGKPWRHFVVSVTEHH